MTDTERRELRDEGDKLREGIEGLSKLAGADDTTAMERTFNLAWSTGVFARFSPQMKREALWALVVPAIERADLDFFVRFGKFLEASINDQSVQPPTECEEKDKFLLQFYWHQPIPGDARSLADFTDRELVQMFYPGCKDPDDRIPAFRKMRQRMGLKRVDTKE